MILFVYLYFSLFLPSFLHWFQYFFFNPYIPLSISFSLRFPEPYLSPYSLSCSSDSFYIIVVLVVYPIDYGLLNVSAETVTLIIISVGRCWVFPLYVSLCFLHSLFETILDTLLQVRYGFYRNSHIFIYCNSVPRFCI